MIERFKKMLAWGLCNLHFDALWRLINRNRLLVVTYHGFYENLNRKSFPLFTHLNVGLFRKHLKFLNKYYNVISLADLKNCLKNGKQLPKNSALITFDDGFRNNYEVAFPVLKEFDLPAVIFLAVDYIGTEKCLWFDELFILLNQFLTLGIDINLLEDCIGNVSEQYAIETLYPICSNRLKKMSIVDRMKILAHIKSRVEKEGEFGLTEQFKLLRWEQIVEMKASGLVEFGVHTATHRIVSELAIDEWEKEIVAPKQKMTEILGGIVDTFCFPNGIPDIDFSKEHEKYLKQNGYICAFSTCEELFSFNDNQYRIGRISVGSDISSDINFFRLKVSGFYRFIKKKMIISK